MKDETRACQFPPPAQARGYLLLITGNADLTDVDDFFGAEMYWSHFDRATSLQMIRDAGFEIVWDQVVADRPSGSHVLALAQKIAEVMGDK